MDFARDSLAALARGFFRLVDGLPEMWSLAAIGIALGLAMLYCFGRLSNQEAIRDARNRIQAHLYEMRLFADEPRLIWRAQIGLLRENARYLALMLIPAAALAVPIAILLPYLDAFYGANPIEPGRSSLVTVRIRAPLEASALAPEIATPDGFVVESPAVRIPMEREVSWRIRPVRAASGELSVTLNGESAAKTIAAGAGPAYLSRLRSASVFDLARYPAEARLHSSAIESIEVDYAPSEIEWLGVSLHWTWWLLMISMGTALVFRRRLRVFF